MADDFDLPDLMTRLRRGDQEAWCQFMDHYSTPLLHCIRRRLPDDAPLRRMYDEEDIAQLVWVEFCSVVRDPTLEIPTPAALMALLKRLVETVVAREYRKNFAQCRDMRRTRVVPSERLDVAEGRKLGQAHERRRAESGEQRALERAEATKMETGRPDRSQSQDADDMKMGQTPNVLFGANPNSIAGADPPDRNQSQFQGDWCEPFSPPVAARLKELLTDGEFELLELRLVRGWKWKNLGMHFDAKPEAVRSHFRRICRRLRSSRQFWEGGGGQGKMSEDAAFSPRLSTVGLEPVAVLVWITVADRSPKC